MKNIFFDKLAIEENGTLVFEDENIAIGAGVRSPNTTYRIDFNYKDCQFTVFCRLGVASFGYISVQSFHKTNNLTEFNINTITHLKNFFLKKESRFKIVSKNKLLKLFIEKNEHFIALSKIANNAKFDPFINCIITNSNFNIRSEFHLEFENLEKTIKPSIELYKSLIDEFE